MSDTTHYSPLTSHYCSANTSPHSPVPECPPSVAYQESASQVQLAMATLQPRSATRNLPRRPSDRQCALSRKLLQSAAPAPLCLSTPARSASESGPTAPS